MRTKWKMFARRSVAERSVERVVHTIRTSLTDYFRHKNCVYADRFMVFAAITHHTMPSNTTRENKNKSQKDLEWNAATKQETSNEPKRWKRQDVDDRKKIYIAKWSLSCVYVWLLQVFLHARRTNWKLKRELEKENWKKAAKRRIRALSRTVCVRQRLRYFIPFSIDISQVSTTTQTHWLADRLSRLIFFGQNFVFKFRSFVRASVAIRSKHHKCTRREVGCSMQYAFECSRCACAFMFFLSLILSSTGECICRHTRSYDLFCSAFG